MKKFLLTAVIITVSFVSYSQLLSWSPNFPVESTGSFTITMDATKGNLGLLSYTPTTDVYVHIGVITNLSTSSSDWKYSKFTWATTNAAANAPSAGTNKWSYTITGGLRTFFGMSNPAETIQKIAILFRNGSGSKKQANTDGTDMYIPVYSGALAARLTVPLMQPTYIPQPETISKVLGNTISMTGVTNFADATSTLKLYFNGTVVNSGTNITTLSQTSTIVVPGNQTIVVESTYGGNTATDTIKFFVAGTVNVAPLPAGVRDGINYENADATKATLVLYAPGKTRVGVIGDLPGSSWAEQAQYQMSKTPDGNYWWITLTGLTTGTEYSFQYLVDGTLKVADAYAEKILDPWNDQYIPSTTYPGLKAYPSSYTSGVVSELQTNAPAYTWGSTSYTRPDKRSVVLYELLVRDFVAKHDWNTLNDTLNYLKNLGINAIEFMPFNEFEGNLSWGYNPDYYFAPDKYYGTSLDLKRLIDSCHAKGIAVVMDIALNHSFGLSPLVQLYWDAANSRPAANNPWFNATATHPYSVGYDMNHASLQTRRYVSRIVEHWLVNYKIDGFRFDLSKGFTQNQTSDVNAWSAYDQSRIDIWKRYHDTIQLKAPGAYTILEHFADNSEETVLSNYGMMLWGNMNYNYSQASMGFSTGWNFDYGIYTARGWSNPGLVTYMESHDEERDMYRNLQYGNSYNAYNIKTLSTALSRMQMNGAFFFTIPGPKMIWQFGELGYDYTIDYCQNGTVNTNCRTDSKPIRWDYFTDVNRKQLYTVWSRLLALRKNPAYTDLFASATQIDRDLSGNIKWLRIVKNAAAIVVVGNFDVAQQTGFITFPSSGVWYDYLNGGTYNATGGAQSFTLQPGEYHVYVNQNPTIPVTIISFNGKNNGDENLLSWNVATEINVSHYEIERSADGRNFATIGKVSATRSNNYNFTDRASVANVVFYYRLRSVDIDGNSKYSGIIKIKNTSKQFFAEAAPNPFVTEIRLNIQSDGNRKVSISVTDVAGRKLIQQNINVAGGVNNVEVSGSQRLSPGNYIVTVTTEQQSQIIKMIKVPK
ncbi:hypothetical protein BH09BAC2_BH09BAC2_05670 [soil metagenome]